MQPILNDQQRLNTILHLEGMPEELPLIADLPDYALLNAEELDEDVLEDHEVSAHDTVIAALNLDNATAVDTFMEAQAEHEYRWQDDAKAEQ
jgi:hypothetical protein